MNDAQVGRVFRAMRIRRGWRQEDLSERAKVGSDAVGLFEHGHIERLSVRAIRRVWGALGIVVDLDPRISPAERAMLLDAGHAALVDSGAAIHQQHGWEAIVEFTFNIAGERGSVDLVAWHPARRALAIDEIKTRLPDMQDLYSSFDRKMRIVPTLLARERGWHADVFGRLLVVADTPTNRRIVRGHAATFRSSFPGDSRVARSWVADPSGPCAAIWFVPYPAGTRSYDVLRRVRRPKTA